MAPSKKRETKKVNQICPTCKQDMTQEHWDLAEDRGLIKKAIEKQKDFNKLIAFATTILAFNVIFDIVILRHPGNFYLEILFFIPFGVTLAFFFYELIKLFKK